MNWTSDRIRQTFLDYYAERTHRALSSLALVPPGDPTLLFTNAGMVQFKDVFTGARKVDYAAACTSQKCLRVSGKHNDLENVGRTARHHTFFEMLGNFSFGKYFKEGAIETAWDLLTRVYGLPTEPLYVTVHPEDDEARQIWKRVSGLPPERILDDSENFWSMGDTGPCGPCSEIHFDQGPAVSGGKEISFEENADLDGDRYLEVWNLVFMQFDRNDAGELKPLPNPAIDTGMGLERICALLQGKTSNYECDLFMPIIERAAELAGIRYGEEGGEQDVALRVIADHSRAAAFLIADGVYPGNEGRSYVIRRVMRRAMRFGRKIGLEEPFLFHTCARVVETMRGAYPELAEKAEVIEKVVRREEETFGRTLAAGLKRLEKTFQQQEAAREIPGAIAFELFDTHGFPLDLTVQAAAERGFSVDQAGFNAAMERQREAGRRSWAGENQDTSVWEALREDAGAVVFSGYERDTDDGRVVAVSEDGTQVVVSRTPFYAESGGQVGDTGRITGADGQVFLVEDTQSPLEGVVVHRGRFEGERFAVGQPAQLEVDAAARDLTRKNHSATHLLHYALRTVLGDHVKQAGSMVGPHRLRFDFSHFGPVTDEEIRRIETLVNERIVRNEAVRTDLLSKEQAVARGAIAFFGDKYGEEVRMLTITADSVELCGGCHVRATGDIGLFRVTAESALASGVRRIEGAVGLDALALVHSRDALLGEIAGALGVGIKEAAGRLQKLQKDHAALSKKLTALQGKELAAGVAGAGLEQIGDIRALALRVDNIKGGALRDMADKARTRLGSGVVLITSANGPKVSLLVAVTEDLTGRVHAGKLLGQLAAIVGGRGGGRPDMAQGGGSDPSRIDEVVERFKELLREATSSAGADA